MRKSQAMEMNESILGTPEHPSNVNKNKNKSKGKRCCLSAVWLMSNALTFMLGYYVKSMYFKDDCLVNESGSV